MASNDFSEITKEKLPSFFQDLHSLLWSQAGLSPEQALEHMTLFFSYRLIEDQVHKMKLAKECRWSYIVSLDDENDLFESLQKGINLFRKNSITKSFFQPHKIKKATLIYDIVHQINRVSVNTLHGTDTLGDIFEYMIGRGMSTMSDEGQYFTNRVICSLAFKLAYAIKQSLRREDGTLCTMGDWFCGTGGFPAEYIRGVLKHLNDVNWARDSKSIYCQDMNMSSVTITLLNMLILTGIPFSDKNIRSGNSFADPITLGNGAHFPAIELDYCFMNPPYGGDKTKGNRYKFTYTKKVEGEKRYYVNQDIRSIGIEDNDKVSAGVQLAMATLADQGVCSIVLPQGFFFGSAKKAIELRKCLCEDYKIHYIVDLEAGAFVNTGTKTSMLVFQKGVGPTQDISFVDVNEKPIMTVSLQELRAGHYSLNYKQYVKRVVEPVEGFELVRLGEIISVESGTYITKKTAKEGSYPVFGGGGCSFYIDQWNREPGFVIGKDGVSEHCVRYVSEKFFLNHHGWTFRTDNADYRYIGYWLISNQAKIFALATGTAQKGINRDSFYSLEIPLPSFKRQQEIVEVIDIYDQLARFEEESLKLLEKSLGTQIKEMSRGQPLVKLGSVVEFRRGQLLKKADFVTGAFPVIGGGTKPVGHHQEFNRESYAILISQSGTAGYVSRYQTKVWASDCFSIQSSDTKVLLDDYLYYILKFQLQESIYELRTGTCQPHIYPSSIEAMQIALPPIAEQQKLAADFKEVRHKHKKLSEYKLKANNAILDLIPRASP